MCDAAISVLIGLNERLGDLSHIENSLSRTTQVSPSIRRLQSLNFYGTDLAPDWLRAEVRGLWHRLRGSSGGQPRKRIRTITQFQPARGGLRTHKGDSQICAWWRAWTQVRDGPRPTCPAWPLPARRPALLRSEEAVLEFAGRE